MIPNQWTEETYRQFANCLPQLADESYRQFHQGLVPGLTNMLGIRLPQLRSLAKQILKGDAEAYLTVSQNDTYEETMLEGFVIGGLKCRLEDLFPYLQRFVPKIDNWAVCDSFCASLKIAGRHRQAMFDFVTPYLLSTHEFERRFALVMLMDYFITDEYIDRVLRIYNAAQPPQYYVRMAAAWGLSVCFVKYEQKTMDALTNSALDDDTYNKALQKIVESRRVDVETKQQIRTMKRKKTKN